LSLFRDKGDGANEKGANGNEEDWGWEGCLEGLDGAFVLGEDVEVSS